MTVRTRGERRNALLPYVQAVPRAECLTLASAGWLLGIPESYVLTRLLVRLVREVAAVEIPVVFPLSNIQLALAGAVVLALVITLLPVRRAVRRRPGSRST
ncbi:MAG: hypothetical protein ACXWZP_01300 [Gaiellaceae bacterium]